MADRGHQRDEGMRKGETRLGDGDSQLALTLIELQKKYIYSSANSELSEFHY